MPATRSRLRRPKIVAHTIDFGDGDTVTFHIDVNKITDAWQNEWTSHEEESNTPQLNAMLADLIEQWDILETDDGPVVPVTADEIGALFSFPMKLRLMKEFYGLPTDAEGNASRNTSSTAPTSSTSEPVSHQNGPATSATPAHSASPSLTQPT